MAEALHPEEQISTVIFVRHGHTAMTEAGKLYSDPATLLSPKGVEQAKAAAQLALLEKPDLLLCSRAARARASADLISAAIKISVEEIDGFEEQNIGAWEGRSYLDLKKNEPELYKQWSLDPIRNRAPGGESIEDLIKRVEASLTKLLLERRGRRIMLVTHAGVIRSAITLALQMPIDNFYRVSVPTGSLSKLDYSESFVTLHYLNAGLGSGPGSPL